MKPPASIEPDLQLVWNLWCRHIFSAVICADCDSVDQQRLLSHLFFPVALCGRQARAAGRTRCRHAVLVGPGWRHQCAGSFNYATVFPSGLPVLPLPFLPATLPDACCFLRSACRTFIDMLNLA